MFQICLLEHVEGYTERAIQFKCLHMLHTFHLRTVWRHVD